MSRERSNRWLIGTASFGVVTAGVLAFVYATRHNVDPPPTSEGDRVAPAELLASERSAPNGTVEPSSITPAVVMLNGYSVDVSAFGSLPASVRERELSLLDKAFDEIVLQRQRREYLIPEDLDWSAMADMASHTVDISSGETEPAPIILLPSFNDAAGGLAEEADAPLVDLRSVYRSS
ncbi:MAG: hypothetical protein AAFN41_08160, partial [Planctomycetota bacterium]